jgi:hypothetical protein
MPFSIEQTHRQLRDNKKQCRSRQSEVVLRRSEAAAYISRLFGDLRKFT